MTPAAPAPPAVPFEPTHPGLWATAAFTLWTVLLSLPMLRGMWLASSWSDQFISGVPFHTWGTEWYKRLGHLPLWDPEVFGGLPFVAAGHGDMFYPTWLLRFIVPVTTAGNLSFFVHYILAGLFTYLLLRRLRVGWIGSVIGGLAYELSGLIASYPSPGHDGKLFASAMLPLMLLALVLALRDRRWVGYPLLGVATALTLLGHFQLAYYSLIVAGLFALYLSLEQAGDSRGGERALRLGMALAAVLIGFGVAAIQILPFFEYIPYSPRAQGFHALGVSRSAGGGPGRVRCDGAGAPAGRALDGRNRPLVPVDQPRRRHAVLHAVVGAHAAGQEDSRARHGVLRGRVRHGAVRRPWRRSRARDQEPARDDRGVDRRRRGHAARHHRRIRPARGRLRVRHPGHHGTERRGRRRARHPLGGGVERPRPRGRRPRPRLRCGPPHTAAPGARVSAHRRHRPLAQCTPVLELHEAVRPRPAGRSCRCDAPPVPRDRPRPHLPRLGSRHIRCSAGPGVPRQRAPVL
ncbi:MAG: hypothetical protein DMD61_14360 [Gemmatimonadetes bacterium]|nr:MAG: hypothetical protein DMD61_14360 [Gemmatimonadota bacterium]